MDPGNGFSCRDALRLVSLIVALPLLLSAALVGEMSRRFDRLCGPAFRRNRRGWNARARNT
jgi:hypothetical protein